MHRTEGPDRDDVHRLERLLEVGVALTSELDLPVVLDQILETARDLTGARYAALGVLDERRRSLQEFVTVGMDDETVRAIGTRPKGHGILGLIIDRPESIRLHDVSQHPRSYGFPEGHPPMKSFLGAPIAIHGEIWGNVYLTDKHGGEDFDDGDIDTIRVLARWAAVAIDNARRFGEATRQRVELERAVKALRTTMEIATAVGDDTDLARNLEVMVSRGRDLVGADALLIWLLDDDVLRIAATSGDADVPTGAVIPLGGSTAGETIDLARSVRIEDAREMTAELGSFRMSRASPLLIVPLIHRGRGLGVLMAFGAVDATVGFDADAQRALEAFAVSAATAVAIAHSVESNRLADTLAAAESERRRWARELHDETLQGLASLKLALALALKAPPADGRALVEAAVEHLASDIAGLRTIISDLRPPTLDELGLEPAIRALVARVAGDAGLVSQVAIDLGEVRLPSYVETTVYRVAQEALTNIVKHAGARSVALTLDRVDRRGLRLVVQDDGVGLGEQRSPGTIRGEGYGLVGMRERAALASGTLDVRAHAGGGTRVTLDLPPSRTATGLAPDR